MAEPFPTGQVSPPLDECARLIGGFRWLEQRLFELLGHWVQTTRLPAAKTELAAQSRHHAGHASLWEEQLPLMAGFDRESVTVAPTAGVAAVVAAAPELGQDDLSRLVVVHRVLVPWLVDAYRSWPGHGPADRPVQRTLRLVLCDEDADLVAGDALIVGLVETPADGRRAVEVHRRAAALLNGD